MGNVVTCKLRFTSMNDHWSIAVLIDLIRNSYSFGRFEKIVVLMRLNMKNTFIFVALSIVLKLFGETISNE